MQVTNTTSILNSTTNNLLSKEDDKVLDNTFESIVKRLEKCMYFAYEMYVHLKIIVFCTILPTF